MTKDEAISLFDSLTHTVRPAGGDSYERYLVWNYNVHDEMHQDENTQGLAEYAPGWEFCDSLADLISQELPKTSKPWLVAAIVIFGHEKVQGLLCGEDGEHVDFYFD